MTCLEGGFLMVLFANKLTRSFQTVGRLWSEQGRKRIRDYLGLMVDLFWNVLSFCLQSLDAELIQKKCCWHYWSVCVIHVGDTNCTKLHSSWSSLEVPFELLTRQETRMKIWTLNQVTDWVSSALSGKLTHRNHFSIHFSFVCLSVCLSHWCDCQLASLPMFPKFTSYYRLLQCLSFIDV